MITIHTAIYSNSIPSDYFAKFGIKAAYLHGKPTLEGILSVECQLNVNCAYLYEYGCVFDKDVYIFTLSDSINKYRDRIVLKSMIIMIL